MDHQFNFLKGKTDAEFVQWLEMKRATNTMDEFLKEASKETVDLLAQRTEALKDFKLPAIAPVPTLVQKETPKQTQTQPTKFTVPPPPAQQEINRQDKKRLQQLEDENVDLIRRVKIHKHELELFKAEVKDLEKEITILKRAETKSEELIADGDLIIMKLERTNNDLREKNIALQNKAKYLTQKTKKQTKIDFSEFDV